jgi:hypothetical protein
MTMKQTKSYEQLTDITLCPQHKHFDGLNVFWRAAKMWKVSLATDKYK